MARRERWLVKAERWLADRAKELALHSNGEALVCFLSRGGRLAAPYENLGQEIAALWHAAEGEYRQLVSKGRIVGTDPRTGRDCKPSPGFWGPGEDRAALLSLDATVLRVVQWAGVSGFDETLEKVGRHLAWEAGMADPRSEAAAYQLFALCRSDLALKIWSGGIQALVDAVLRGKPEPGQPWKLRLFHPHESAEDGCEGALVDSLAIAAALFFALLRGVAVDATLAQRIPRLVIKKQSESGAWPGIGRYLDDVDSVLHTAMAIHALSMVSPKPRGAVNALAQAAEWLLGQQQGDGSWRQDGVDPVYLTVLVLDALALMTGSEKVTFTLTESELAPVRQPPRKPGPKERVPKAAYPEIQATYAKAQTKGQKGEILNTFARQYDVTKDYVGRIARKKP